MPSLEALEYMLENSLNGIPLVVPTGGIEVKAPASNEMYVCNIDYEHVQIHAGNAYTIKDVVELSDGEYYDLRFTTPNSLKLPHVTFTLIGEKEVEYWIYEGVTIETAGTAVTPMNNNRNSTNTSDMVASTILNTNVGNANADTAIATATLLEHGKVGTGTAGFFSSADSGSSERQNEWVLDTNTIYSFRATAPAACYLDFALHWYEVIKPHD